jgi:hypothetical protein
MSFHEWMEMSEKLWGPEAMLVFSKYALGQINLETCIDQAEQAYLNYLGGSRP